MRTAEQIEENKASRGENPKQAKDFDRRKLNGKHPRSQANLKPYPKGVSGNPTGMPGYDVAAEIARATITEFKEEAFAGLGKQLAAGNAYAFKELAERGYGKLADKLHVSGLDSIAEVLAKARQRAK